MPSDTFAVFFMLLAAASCFPVQDPCADVRESSIELNHIAKNASVEARNNSKNVANFSSPLEWIEAKDMCDPENLKKKPLQCIQKISSVLKSYEVALGIVEPFEVCSLHVRRVKLPLTKLQENVDSCLKSKGGNHKNIPQVAHISRKEADNMEPWNKTLMCHYVLDRLFSFSILTARVFAVGDPAYHADAHSKNVCSK